MKIGNSQFLILFLVLTVSQLFGQSKTPSFSLTKSILLVGVHGKFDHMAIDDKNQKLFLAAKGNNTVEVIDIISGKMIHSIKEVIAPQGILFMPKKNLIVVCGGGDGKVKGFDATSYQLKFSISLGKEADNIRYSEVTHKIYVAFGDGAVAIIDDSSYKKVSEISFKAHPEAFSIDSVGKKLWVNLPDEGIISVIDLSTNKVKENWKTIGHIDNYPMSLIENSHKLVVASRTIPAITFLNSESGKILQSFVCDSDPDAMFYDKRTDQLFISCGGGSLYILKNVSKESIQQPTVMKTRKGARTCLWSTNTNTLYLALPEFDNKPAEIQIFK